MGLVVVLVGIMVSWDNAKNSNTVMMAEDLLNTVKKQDKHVLVTLDEVYSTDSLKELAS